MTQSQYVIRRKLNILELGETLGNISDACRKLGVTATITTSNLLLRKRAWQDSLKSPGRPLDLPTGLP